MNQVAEMKWPSALGGDAIERPRGVMVIGDCIDDGDVQRGGKNWSPEEFGYFVKELELDGRDGFVKYPVFDRPVGWADGHHACMIGKFHRAKRGKKGGGTRFTRPTLQVCQLSATETRGFVKQLARNHYSRRFIKRRDLCE
jgi:hypothetical protein